MFSIPSFGQAKRAGTPIIMLTCYDAPGASALEESGVDAVLVGDSVAMVVHGHDSTLTADMAMIESHVRAVRAGGPGLCIVADMPFLSTRTGLADGVRNAGILMRAGANAVKIEGLPGHEELIPHLVASGIPVMGHLGLQPQSVNVYGAYRVQGKEVDQAAHILAEARTLEELGCFAVVLECVPSDLANRVTGALGIATIGIGAGVGTDGQILVWHDLLGLPVHPERKTARFVRKVADLRGTVRAAVAVWAKAVRDRSFPRPEESFGPGPGGTGTSHGSHGSQGTGMAGHDGQSGKTTPDLVLYGVGASTGSARAGTLPVPDRTIAGLAVFENPSTFKAWCRASSASGSLGLVPTMGALHEGHASLVRQSAADNAATAVSIFVNPTQFNDPKDLATYPRTLEADCALLAGAGATAVFLPTRETMYPDDYHYKLTETELSTRFCGAHRPGHFDGVLTVVMKLLQLAQADKAYFGEKDFQQYLLIKGMADAYFLDTVIVPCPIVRETNGLAMSSRNTRLSMQGREEAAAIHRALTGHVLADRARADLEARGFEVEYLDDWTDPATGTGRRLVAAWHEGVRLIDNVPVPVISAKGSHE